MSTRHQSKGLFIRSLIVGSVGCAGVGQSIHAALLYSPVVTIVGDGVTTGSRSVPTTIATYNHTLPEQAGPVGSAAYNSGVSGTRLVNLFNQASEGTLTNNPALTNAAAAGILYTGNAYAYSAGYDAASGNTSANVLPEARVVGRVTLNGQSVSGATVLQSQFDAYNSNVIRGATGTDAAISPTLYSAGAGTLNNGWRDFSSNTQLSAAPTSVRSVELVGGRLFGTTNASPAGIYLIDPTGASSAAVFIQATAGLSPSEFVLFNDANITASIEGFNTAYIADESSSGSISKYTYDGSGWALQYAVATGGYRGLAGQLDAQTGLYTLFATTTASSTNRLVQITDLGANSPEITLATASAGTLFRGVALTVPTPGTACLLTFGGIAVMRRRRK